jgi:hypothetical protein
VRNERQNGKGKNGKPKQRRYSAQHDTLRPTEEAITPDTLSS